jgi:UDP-arabinose 4-epimerase
MAILVTGGAGYIGSHTAKALHQAGREVVVFDNLLHGHEWAVRWGRLERGDLADRAVLEKIFDQYQIDAVVHFAALIQVGESMHEPGLYFQNNTAGTLNLLRVMESRHVRRIVFSSTAAVYGMPEKMPITEQAPARPINAYGETKWMVERLFHWFRVAHGLDWVALRYFNACGADPEGEIGEDHEPESHLIPRVIAAALGKLPQIEVYGTDFPTPDGTCIRDYIHVADLASAHLRALEHLEQGGESGAFNLGTGQGTSVRQIISGVEQLAGRPVPVRYGPRRDGDPPELVADPARARGELRWEPRHSDLDTILGTAWNWHAVQGKGLSGVV